MENITPIKYLAKVEIKALWNKYNLVWNLNEDVNILSGINGSGKSTILECITEVLIMGTIPEKYQKIINKVTIAYDNDIKYSAEELEDVKDVIRYFEANANEDIKLAKLFKEIKQRLGNNYSDSNLATALLPHFNSISSKLQEINKILTIDTISTFDNIINSGIRKPDERVNTELDWKIAILQKQYLDYQLNISKEKDAIIDSQEAIQEKIEQLRYPQKRFVEIIDSLFSQTGKKLNTQKNEIEFLFDNTELSPYQLSSGEKQMLLILLTVLVQHNKPSILLMDEPEISLHFDWQKKLIQYIRELNPNVQIILATHSPAVIMECWKDKVFDVKDLITTETDKAI